MALTQKIGALANAGAQAQSVASTLANLAANLHYTGGGGQPQKSYGQEPVYYAPAPVNTYRPPQQTGSFSSGSSAAAAQHLIQQARNQQQIKQNVFNDAAKQAVLTALAVATGQQPGRSYTTPPTLQYRQGGDAAGHQLAPQQESQLFDQQIQATKLAASQQAMPGVFTPDSGTRQRINGFNANIDTMRSGFTNARPNPRLTQEGQVLSAFPRMTPQELRTRGGSQLQAMLDLAKQPPASAAGSSDQVGGQETSPTPMTHNQPPKGPPPQPAYSPLPTWDTTRGAPAQPPYNPLPTGPAMVSAAFTDALNRGQVTGQTQGGQMADGGGGGGGFWNTVGNVIDAGLHAGGPVNPIALFESLVENGKDIASYLSPDFVTDMLGQLKDGAAGTYEAFVTSAPGQVIEKILNGLDIGRQWNTGNVGALAYRTATKSPFFGPGDWDSDHYISLMPPLALAFEAAYRADPTLEARVVDWHDNGYSSPSYIKTAEAAGIDWHEQPQFTGDQAVYEGLMGLTDDMPDVLKYPFRMATDVLLDPLSMLTVAAEGGALAREIGIGLRTADEATLGGRVIGGILEGTGAAVEGGARLPDLPVEGLIKGGKGIGSKVGEVTGLLSPSTEAQRVIARAQTATSDELIQAARESVPEPDGRRLFDAEAQGVEPSSGPELINANSAVDDVPPSSGSIAPTASETNSMGRPDTPNARTALGANTAPNRTGGASAIETDSIAAPPFEDLPDAPGSTPEHPSKRYDYGGQTLVIRSETAKDGSLFFSAFRPGATKPNQMLTADTYAELIDTLPSKFGPPLGPTATTPRPTVAAPTATSPVAATADLDRRIDEQRSILRSGTMTEQSAATVEIGRLQREKVARIQEATTRRAQDKPPTAQAQRAAQAEASAATSANTVPNRPRNPAEAQTVAAADHAKTGDPKRKPMKPADRKKFPAIAKAEDRYRRLAKEDREGLPKEVSAILRKQEPGEHEFSPIYGGNRPIDRIVTEAIDSGDPAKLAQAEQLVKRLDEKVEQELRPDPFYQTWKNGGAPVYLQDDPRFTDAFFEQMRVLDPSADPKRLRVLANGLAKGVLDDIALLQFQLNQVVPLIRELYPEATLDGIFGTVGRAASRDFKDESAAWLLREYLLTSDAGRADTILRSFLTNADELAIIADGVHKPYAHSVPAGHETESLARLIQMREQATAMKRAEQFRDGSLAEVSMAPFREPDVAAQFAGGLKGSSKSFAESLRAARAATRHHVTTDAMVEAAIGEIRDPQLRFLLLNGDGGLTVEMAQVADRMLPETWRPPNYAGDKTSWNVREALDALAVTKETDPAFDLNRARDEVAELGAGLTPKRTAAELASMRKAAKAQGLDPKLITNGASTMERATATRLVRAIDKYLSYWRQLRLFNVVTGLPNRIGDQVGNMTTLALRGDPIDVLRYLPGSAKATRTLRASGRDAHRALDAMVLDSPIMRETGQTFPTDLIPGKVLNDIERSGLPVYNDLLRSTPAGVRATANLATVPLLKDVTVAGEMAGRKIAFESVYTETLARESLPASRNGCGRRTQPRPTRC